jgi:hypothetical protein
MNSKFADKGKIITYDIDWDNRNGNSPAVLDDSDFET